MTSMGGPESTRWSIIRDAAGGDGPARSVFARCYEPVVRAFLGARWARTGYFDLLDDATQDVFVDCLKDDGALTRARSGTKGGFRAYLYGIVRNVARRHEEKIRRRKEVDGVPAEPVQEDEETLSQAFDRAWGRSILREAADLMAERARARGGASERRVELLRLHFEESLAIHEIAKVWDADVKKLHVDYARARDDYESALRTVLRAHFPDREVNAECARLLDLFS
jgi:RNA polymerase sigma-70 factor (ECF subfamily)